MASPEIARAQATRAVVADELRIEIRAHKITVTHAAKTLEEDWLSSRPRERMRSSGHRPGDRVRSQSTRPVAALVTTLAGTPPAAVVATIGPLSKCNMSEAPRGSSGATATDKRWSSTLGPQARGCDHLRRCGLNRSGRTRCPRRRLGRCRDHGAVQGPALGCRRRRDVIPPNARHQQRPQPESASLRYGHKMSQLDRSRLQARGRGCQRRVRADPAGLVADCPSGAGCRGGVVHRIACSVTRSRSSPQ